MAATFVHDEKGLPALCRTLVRLRVQLVAIERPDGLLVERLLDAGLRVLPMHPKQVASSRRGSGPRAASLTGSMRSCCASSRVQTAIASGCWSPTAIRPKALRALTRTREDLVHARVALSGQLRAELERFWPGPIGLFTKLDSPISLAFLERYPSPADARARGSRRRGRDGRKASDRAALVAAISPLVEQIKQLTQQIATALREHPDGEIFTSLFRTPGSVVTPPNCWPRSATAERVSRRARRWRPTPAKPPQSGNHEAANFRWGCNKRMRGAFCTLADSTRHSHRFPYPLPRRRARVRP